MIHETLEKLQVPIEGLRPYHRNPRQGDVGTIMQSLEHHGQYRPIVVNSRTQEVLAGNHTLEAARQLGWEQIAATFVDVDEDQAARIVLVDNRSTDLAAYDDAVLAELLEELAKTDQGLSGVGFDGDDLDQLLADLKADEGENTYTTTIESPIYEPSGPPPAIQDLASTAVRDELLAEIDAADLLPEVTDFLRLAAHRHTRFDYETIANYYAHAPENIRKLMEASALVIVDYDQAVERGFVRLHEAIGEAFGEDYPDA